MESNHKQLCARVCVCLTDKVEDAERVAGPRRMSYLHAVHVLGCIHHPDVRSVVIIVPMSSPSVRLTNIVRHTTQV